MSIQQYHFFWWYCSFWYVKPQRFLAKNILKKLLVIYLTISFQLSPKFSKLNVPPWFFSSKKTNLWILASQPFGPHQVAQHQMPKIRSPAWLRGNGSLEPGEPSRNREVVSTGQTPWDFYTGVEKHGVIWVFYVVFIWFYVVFYGVNMVLIGFYLFFMWLLELYLWEHVWKCSAMTMTVSGSLNHHSAQSQQCPPPKKKTTDPIFRQTHLNF